MKGPGGKRQYHFRRLWRCPQCQRREWTAGHVVARACRCTPADAAQPVWMQLVESQANPYLHAHDDTAAPGA
jgi:hypothetical protein